MSAQPFPPHLPDGDALVAAIASAAQCEVKRERGSEVILTPCPFCRKAGDRFAVNIETGLWNCPRCGEKGNAWQMSERLGLAPVQPLRVSVPTNGHAKQAKPRLAQDVVDREVEARRVELHENNAVLDYLAGRGLSIETIRAWGLCAKGSAVGFVYLRDNGKVAFVKYRDTTDKSRQWIWPSTDERPFPPAEPLYARRDLDPSKAVTITEGEWDALTLWQNGTRNVASVANGARGWKTDWSVMLAGVPMLVLAYDQDVEGEAGAKACLDKFGPERCVRVTFGEHKDANDALKAGWTMSDFQEAISAAKRYPHPIIRSVRDVIEEVAESMSSGTRRVAMRTGWPSLDDTQRGIRDGELTVVTAHTGAGKTTFTLDLALRLAESGESVCYFSMEQGPQDTALQVVAMAARRNTEDMSPDDLRGAVGRVPESFLLGVEPERDRAEQIAAAVKYATIVYGVRLVVVDHLDHLIETRERESRYEAASRAVKAMHKIGRDNRVHVLLICQPTTDSGRHRDKGTGKPGEIRLEDIAETRLARQLANNGWLVESDKGKRTTTVTVAKARHGPALEGVRLRYAFDGFRLTDIGREMPQWAKQGEQR